VSYVIRPSDEFWPSYSPPSQASDVLKPPYSPFQSTDTQKPSYSQPTQQSDVSQASYSRPSANDIAPPAPPPLGGDTHYHIHVNDSKQLSPLKDIFSGKTTVRPPLVPTKSPWRPAKVRRPVKSKPKKFFWKQSRKPKKGFLEVLQEKFKFN